jgi:hypothetical protein
MEYSKTLLKAKADQNHPCGPLCQFSYALEKAAHQRKLDMAELLLKNGANPTLLSDFRDSGSALAAAARRCRKAVCESLIEHGADASQPLTGGKYGSASAAALASREPDYTLGLTRYLVEDAHADTNVLSTDPPRRTSCHQEYRSHMNEYLTEDHHVEKDLLMEIGLEMYAICQTLETGSLSTADTCRYTESLHSHPDYSESESE